MADKKQCVSVYFTKEEKQLLQQKAAKEGRSIASQSHLLIMKSLMVEKHDQ